MIARSSLPVLTSLKSLWNSLPTANIVGGVVPRIRISGNMVHISREITGLRTSR